MYFWFKKIVKIIQIYKTSEKTDERFQLVYGKAVNLTNRFDSEDREPCICGQHIDRYNIPSESVKAEISIAF